MGKIHTSQTKKIETQMGTLYITLLYDEKRVIQVMLNLGKAGTEANYFSEALARVTSIALQAGVSIDLISKELEEIGGRYDTPTVPDALAIALSETKEIA